MNENMEYGFEDFDGNAWSNHAVDTYNRINEEVRKRDKLPYDDRSSLSFKELEFYKDQRHKTFVQLMDIAAENLIKRNKISSFVPDFIAP